MGGIKPTKSCLPLLLMADSLIKVPAHAKIALISVLKEIPLRTKPHTPAYALFVVVKAAKKDNMVCRKKIPMSPADWGKQLRRAA